MLTITNGNDIIITPHNERMLTMEENRTTVTTSSVEEAPKSVPNGTPTPPPQYGTPGTPAQPPVQGRPPYPPYTAYKPVPPVKVAKPFFGFNIVALVLGIYSLLEGISGLAEAIEVLYDCLSMSLGNFESIGRYVANCSASLIVAAVCLIFGFIGYRKKENYGRSLGLAGLICGGIGFVSLVASLIIFILA